MKTTLPVPVPDTDSEPFWAGCREGHLSAQRCPACLRLRWPPMQFCPWCHAQGGEWIELPGTGVVQSFVVVQRAFDPAFSEEIPYVVAHITLDGAPGVTVIGNVVADPADAVAIGECVAVEFRDRGQMALPLFRPLRPA